MTAILGSLDEGATNGRGHSGSIEKAADQSDSEDCGWFAELARPLLAGADAGFALHILTGFHERTCYRYAAGDRKPPAYFLRALLHSDQGATWLSAIMDGCEAPWWLDASAKLDMLKGFQVRKV